MNYQSTIDASELVKFAQHADSWWDLHGPLKTLHDINPVRLEFIAQQVTLNNLSVLDVGCGGGILSEGMAKLGALVTGIDASSEAIDTAVKHALGNKLPIHYECHPIEEYEHTGFDFITCLELLEHVQNPELVIQHCKRLLKPGGVLFLSTINRTIKAYAFAVVAAEYIFKLLPKQTHDYGKFIQPSELVQSARAVGLDFLDLKGLHYNPISRSAHLVNDVAVNYLMAFKNRID